MKKSIKICFLVILFLIMLSISLYFYNNELFGYVIVFGVITLISLVFLVISIFSADNDDAVYKRKLQNVLKTYESILVKSVAIPKLDDKNVIVVDSFEDLVNAQVEIRKPIYYKMELSSCSFCLLDTTEACVYIMKVNDEIISDLELSLRDLELKNRKKDSDYSLLDDVTRTLIIKLENSKAFKVSPLRKNSSANFEEVEELI